MKSFKQLALVGLLSFGIANANITLDVTFKDGEDVKGLSTFVVKDGEAVSITRNEKTVSILATPTEDGVSIEVALEGHTTTQGKTVQWGECAEFSCTETDCCLMVVAEQE